MSEQLPHDEELRALYRKLPADEPRAEIDEAILSAARGLADAAARELAQERQRRRFLARVRWTVPLAAAASVVLMLTITRFTPKQSAIPSASLEELRSDSGDAETMTTKSAKGTRDTDRARAAMKSRQQEVAKPKEEAMAQPMSPPPRPAPPSAASAEAPAAAPVGAPAAAAGAPAASLEENTASAPAGSDARRAEASPDNRAQLADEALARKAPEPKRDAAEKDSSVALPLSSLGGATVPDATVEAAARAGTWPFRLEPGLDSAEVCRRVVAAVNGSCRFAGEAAVIDLREPVVADAGEFAGKKLTRLTLTLRNEKLWKVALRVEGFATEQILVAPE